MALIEIPPVPGWRPTQADRDAIGRMLDHVYGRLTDVDAFGAIALLRDALDGAELTIMRGYPPVEEDGLAQ